MKVILFALVTMIHQMAHAEWKYRHGGFEFDDRITRHSDIFFSTSSPQVISAVELYHFGNEIQVQIVPTAKVKIAFKQILTNYMRDKIGIESDWSMTGRIFSRKFTDKEADRTFFIKNDLGPFDAFSFSISLRPEFQSVWHKIPDTDCAATEIVAGILKQISKYEGEKFEKNVYQFCVSESAQSKHFVIKDTPRAVQKFAEVIDMLYKSAANDNSCSFD